MSLGHDTIGGAPLATAATAGSSAPPAVAAVADIAATLIVTGSVALEHSAAAVIALSSGIAVSAALSGSHGVAVSAAAAVDVRATQSVAHGVCGDSAATVALVAAVDITVLRYEVRGEVRDGGVLVNRRVRAYLRSSGALLGENDTVAGRFKVHAGFAAVECYITPIDLSDTASDWLPPTANRVFAALASDLV